MVHRDPPVHTRLRTLVSKAFTPHAIEAMGSWITPLAERLVTAAKSREHGARMDLVSDFAYPLTVAVIARMLGIPSNYLQRLERWAEARRAVLESSSRALGLSELNEVFERAGLATEEFNAALRSLIAERRNVASQDLLTGLLEAEEAGDRLSEDELLAMCRLVISAGHETTVKLISNGMFALLTTPAQKELLKRDPRLLQCAVQEMLRYDTPVQLTARSVYEDIELGGTRIPKGSTVILLLGAANRDPAIFPEPDRFDIQRSMNPPVSSFGLGIHHCLGAALAKLETEIAVRTLLRELPALELEDGAQQGGVVFRGFERLFARW
jgi:cytochrome P450